MYVLKPGIKRDPERRWKLPDRIFFGHGACHILAGVYLRVSPLGGFHAERIIPVNDFAGNHIYVTDGQIAFDYHGYSTLKNLTEHHRKGWSRAQEGWDFYVEKVTFNLLETSALNQRKMRGPDQYLHNPIPRAERYLNCINHTDASDRVRLKTILENNTGSVKDNGNFSQPLTNVKRA